MTSHGTGCHVPRLTTCNRAHQLCSRMRDSTRQSTTGSSSVLLHGETTPKIHNRKPELHLTLPSAVMQYADDCWQDVAPRRDMSGNTPKSILNRNAGRAATGSTAGSRRRFKPNQRHKPGSIWAPLCRLVLVGLVMMIVWQRFRVSPSYKKMNPYDRAATNITLEHVPATAQRHATDRAMESSTTDTALDDFTSLHAALDSSDLVILYFAAAWCPMSTPITIRLDHLFRDRLEDVEHNVHPRLAIVYVSSDKDVASFDSYVQPGWLTVPFANVDERSALKRHFRTAAKREMDEVGLESRDYEIPNVIVVAGVTREVITFEGIADLKELGSEALTHWMDLNPSPSRTATLTHA